MKRDDIKESKSQREARIAGTGNGATLRTRVRLDRTKYSRKIKHKKSIAEAMDFAIMLPIFYMFAIFMAWIQKNFNKIRLTLLSMRSIIRTIWFPSPVKTSSRFRCRH